jgi:hypothetical protein
VEFKHIAFLLALVLVLTLGRTLCTRHKVLRDACAFVFVLGTTRADMLDVNFLSREWYRGTTRGIEISWLDLLWILLLSSLPRKRHRPLWVPGLGPMLIFFVYNLLIVIYSEPSIFGVFELSKMFRQICVFVTIAHYVNGDQELLVIGRALVIAIGYEFIFSARSRFLWGVARAEGTLGHPNALSMYELMAVPVLIALSAAKVRQSLRQWISIAAILGAITVLLTVSRNGIFSLVIIGSFMAFACGSLRGLTRRHIRLVIATGAILGVFMIIAYKDLQSRFETDAIGKEYSGKVWEGRGAYLVLAKYIVAREPFGCGLNNWSWCVSNRYGPLIEQYYAPYTSTDAAPPRRRLRRHAHIDAQQAAPAHSLYAITLGETGWPGVFLYSIVWIRWFMIAAAFVRSRSSNLRHRFGVGVFGALIGALGQSFSEWEIRLTPLAFLLHILLGAASAAHPGSRFSWKTMSVEE